MPRPDEPIPDDGPGPLPLRPGRRHPAPSVVVAVAVGGALGTLVRWLLVAPPPEAGGTPVAEWVTLGSVNLSGSLLLGLLTGYGFRRRLPPWLTAGLGTGMMGAYTSLSAVVLAAAVTPALGIGDYMRTGSPDGWVLLAGLAGMLLALAAGAALGTAAALVGLHLGGYPHRHRHVNHQVRRRRARTRGPGA